MDVAACQALMVGQATVVSTGARRTANPAIKTAKQVVSQVIAKSMGDLDKMFALSLGEG